MFDQVSSALKEKGYSVLVVNSKLEALNQIKTLIPVGVSVMNGTSVSLEQIGYMDYLKAGNHGWNNLHANIVAEADPKKRSLLRKQAVLSDYYLGSVHALTETGEFIIASNTGSQLPHIAFTSTNLIFVVGKQKIVPNIEAGFKRLYETVAPLEDKHMMDLYKVHTFPSKILIFNRESPNSARKITFILVNETLGY